MGGLFNWDNFFNNRFSSLYFGSRGISWGSRVAWFVLRVLSFTFVCHLSNITLRGGSVGNNLCTSIRKSNPVSTLSIVTITLLIGIKVNEAVVILYSIAILVNWGEVRIGHRGGDIGCWSRSIALGSWGAKGCGKEAKGEDNLESHVDVLDCDLEQNPM